MNIMSRIRSWFRVEAEKLRPMTLQQKISYLTMYYTKWVVLYLIIALVVGFGVDALIQSRKESVLQGYFTNDDNNNFPGSRMEKEYSALLNLGYGQRIVFDDTLYFDLEGSANEYTAASNGKVIATMAVNQLDFMVTTRPVLEHFRGELPMKDLEAFLPEDLLEALEGAMVPGLNEKGEEALVGINMARSRYLKDLEPEGEFYLFIPYNIPNEEALIAYLRFCFL